MNNAAKTGYRFALTPLALSAALFIAACGGGDGDTASAPPMIAAQPAEQSVVAGRAATFSVTASGDSLGYQWQVSKDNGTSWTDIAGATSATYTVDSADAGASGTAYRVVISSGGQSVTSSPVRLTVTAAVAAPAISVDVAAVTVTAGADAVFSVTASGTSLVYQWQVSTDGANFSNIAGANAATLTLPAVALTDSGKSVRVAVKNSAGTVTSSAAVLSVTPAAVDATIVAQPAGASVTASGRATFTVVASGTPAPAYQWQKSTDNGATWVDIGGAVAASYTTDPTAVVDSGSLFRVKVSNATANVTSAPAALTVAAAPVPVAITTQPSASSVTAPSTATFTTVATGSPTPTYQWQIRDTADGSTFVNITGATSATYATPATTVADSGKQFRVVVNNGSGSVTSAVVTLTVAAQAAASASAHYYLLANAGPTVAATVTTARGSTPSDSQALFAVDSANPSAPPVVVAPAGAGHVSGPFFEASVVAGQVSNARSRFGVFVNSDRYYKVDQVVPEGSVPKASLLSNLRASQVCSGPTNAPDTLGWNIVHPQASWAYFQTTASGSCTDIKTVAVRLDMEGSDEPRVLPGLPVMDIVGADGSFAGLLVAVPGFRVLRFDADLMNFTPAFSGTFLAKWGATAPFNVLYTNAGQVWALSLTSSATTAVPVATFDNEEKFSVNVDGGDVLLTLTRPQIPGPEGTISRAASYRTLRITSAFQTSVESSGAGTGPAATTRALLNGPILPATSSLQEFFLSSKPYYALQLDATGELTVVDLTSGGTVLDIGGVPNFRFSQFYNSGFAIPIQLGQPGLIRQGNGGLIDILFYSTGQSGITRVTNFLNTN